MVSCSENQLSHCLLWSTRIALHLITALIQGITHWNIAKSHLSSKSFENIYIMASWTKRNFVIGGTGAQGYAVIKALLSAPSSPFSVGVFTRNPNNPKVLKDFEDTGVELIEGSFMNFNSIERALQDCYGVYVNTDGKNWGRSPRRPH